MTERHGERERGGGAGERAWSKRDFKLVVAAVKLIAYLHHHSLPASPDVTTGVENSR